MTQQKHSGIGKLTQRDATIVALSTRVAALPKSDLNMWFYDSIRVVIWGSATLHLNRKFTHRNQFSNKLICGERTKQKQNNNNNNNNKSNLLVFVSKQPVLLYQSCCNNGNYSGWVAREHLTASESAIFNGLNQNYPCHIRKYI